MLFQNYSSTGHKVLQLQPKHVIALHRIILLTFQMGMFIWDYISCSHHSESQGKHVRVQRNKYLSCLCFFFKSFTFSLRLLFKNYLKKIYQSYPDHSRIIKRGKPTVLLSILLTIRY